MRLSLKSGVGKQGMEREKPESLKPGTRKAGMLGTQNEIRFRVSKILAFLVPGFKDFGFSRSILNSIPRFPIQSFKDSQIIPLL